MVSILKSMACAAGFVLATGHALCAEDIGALLGKNQGDVTLSLTENGTADNAVIAGRSVTISNDGDSSYTISNQSQAPIFTVVDGGHLTLDLVALYSQEDQPGDTLVYVEQGTLTLNNCFFTTQRRFAIYMRRGVLNLKDCGFWDAQTAIALTEGSTSTIQTAEISNSVQGAIWVTGEKSSLVLKDSLLSYGSRGVAVDDGASLFVENTEFFNATEVSIFADTASVTLKDIWVEGAENYGIYAQNGSQVSVERATLTGPMDTGITMVDAAGAFTDVHMTDAATGVSINGGHSPVDFERVYFTTSGKEAIHILSGGAGASVVQSVFEGGGTGIGVLSGTLDVAESQFAGQHSSGVQLNQDAAVGAVNIANSAFVPELSGVAVYANAPFYMSGSDIVYEDIALGGEALGASEVIHSVFFGPGDGYLSAGAAPANMSLINQIVIAEDAQVLWQNIVSAADTEGRDIAITAMRAAYPKTQGGLARLSLFDLESNSPFEPSGNAALGNLHRVFADGRRDWLGDIYVSDLPLDMLPGLYAFEQEQSWTEIDLQAEGAEYWIELPAITSPFGLERDGDVIRRGPALALRRQAELVQVMKSRWPGYRPYELLPVARPDATAEARILARAKARKDLEAAVQFLASLPADATYNDLSRETREEMTRHIYQHTLLARAVLSSVGTEKDASWLFAQTAPYIGGSGHFLARRLWETVVEIETRLGILSVGATADALAALKQDYQHPHFAPLAAFRARSGDRDATEALIDAIAVTRSTVTWSNDDRFLGFSVILNEPVPAVTELALEFVEEFEGQVLLMHHKDADVDAQYEGLYKSSAFLQAFLHAAAFAPEEDRARLNVPIPQWNQMFDLGPAFDNPADLLGHIVAMDTPNPRGMRNSELAFAICKLTAGRADKPAWAEALQSKLLSYGTLFPNDVPRPGYWAEFVATAGTTHCQSDSASLDHLERPENRDYSIFSEPWGFAFYSPDQMLTDATARADHAIPSINVLDSAPDYMRNRALAASDDTLGMRRYKSYQSVATSGKVAQTGPFTGAADTRVFLEPVQIAKENHQLFWLAGTAKLAPIEVGNQTLFGLSISVNGTSHAGLAAAIGRHPEVIAKNVANHGGDLLRRVVLRHGDQSTEMTRLRTLESGVHVYELSATPKDQSNLIVDAYFETRGTDDQTLRRWTISWPLYRSPFGFQQISDHGRVTVRGADQ
ncbi:right-handed parallel beta-helix repeat-containing protein [Cognatishimia sp.]|uniref:right-handed parallel beta-helix repeat-containing protein n=1 Tax=Cognatishimia sp. TaxID=2211648 RepID=UPI003BAB3FF7